MFKYKSYYYFNMSENSDRLEEVSTQERIDLVNDDKVRRWGQIIIAFILIGTMISFLGYYTIAEADAEFKLSLASTMLTLFTMGTGAALAIFGLGRTVGRKS